MFVPPSWRHRGGWILHKIALLPGDGIGPEVMAAAQPVLDAVGFQAEFVPAAVGWECWRQEGTALPVKTMKVLESTECCLFGAITSKPDKEAQEELPPELKGKGIVYRSPIVEIRQRLSLRANFRPCKAYPGNPLNFKEGIDIVVVRENTEGLYAGVEYAPVPDQLRRFLGDTSPAMDRFQPIPNEDMAIGLRIITLPGARTVIDQGFAYAAAKHRKKVTIIEKPNVLRRTSGLFLEEARKAAAKYPAIPMDEMNIDSACMAILKRPKDFDVIITSNLFGDILSDLCGQLTGGLGFAPSASIGGRYALFEPVHGSAPKYAGKNVANPTAMILSAGLMLEHLKLPLKAKRIEHAVAKVIAEGMARTKDMGGTTTTTDMGRAIADAVATAG